MVVLLIRDENGQIMGTLTCPTYDHLNDVMQAIDVPANWPTQLILPED